MNWTPEKVEYLKLNYNLKSAEDLAKEIGCTPTAVFQKAFKLKIKGRPNGSWNKEVHSILTREDIQFLKDNYEQHGTKYCAEKLNIKYGTIQKNAANLGLKTIKKIGKDHHAWKGGFRSAQDRFRTLQKYWKWHKLVTDRDNSCCITCGTDKNIQVHHNIKLYDLIKNYCSINNITPSEMLDKDINNDYFYDVDNGQTLCEVCHREWHKKNGY